MDAAGAPVKTAVLLGCFPDTRTGRVPGMDSGAGSSPLTRTERRVLGLALWVGSLVGLCYCAIAYHFRPGDGVAVELRDTYLFYQYAAAISEGHPYAFMAGDAPSTGSTSHLYPALLAIFHRLGASGDALSGAGLGLSFASFLASLVCVFLLVRRLAPEALVLALALNATSGHLAITVFGQTDASLFIPLALGSFAAFAYERRKTLAVGLVLLSLTRPEGFVLSFTLLCADGWRSRRSGERWRYALPATLGIGAFAGTLLVNQLLTGSWLPQSVLAKGVFAEHPLDGATFLTARAVFDVFSELVLGLGEGGRRYYLLPLIGGVCGLAGLLSRIGSRSAGQLFDRWWSSAALLSIGIAIVGGVSGIHHDRYFGWMMPVWLIYVAIGVHNLSDRFAAPALRTALAALLLFFQVVGSAYMASSFASGCARTASSVRFVKRVDAQLPEPTRLGFATASGLAYFLPRHHVTHVNGIVSPAFAHRHPNVVGAEILEHRPELRFDYWLMKASSSRLWYEPFLGQPVSIEPFEDSGGDPFVLYRAEWGSITAVEEPLSKAVIERVQDLDPLPPLDVGWIPSEERCGYATRRRVPGAFVEPLLATGNLEGRRVSDVGRFISGSESFFVPDATGPLSMVIRTTASAAAVVRSGANTSVRRLPVRSPVELQIRVDGGPAVVHRLPLVEDPRLIQEFVVELDAGTSEGADGRRVEIEGDYISLGYWFYRRDAGLGQDSP